MARRDGGDAPPAEHDRPSELDLLVAHERRLGRWNLAEVRPYRPVEQVIAQDLDRRAGRIDGDRPRAHPAHRIHEEWNRGDVIQMRVRDENVVDLRELGERQVAHAAAGVDENVGVEEERGRAQVTAADASRASEHAQAHGYFSSNAMTGASPGACGERRSTAMRS